MNKTQYRWETAVEILVFPKGGFFFPNGIARKISSGNVYMILKMTDIPSYQIGQPNSLKEKMPILPASSRILTKR
jgi:hypothetical protein